MSQELVFDMQKHIPKLEIWDLPYLFRNDDHVDRYVESDEAKKIFKKLNPMGLVGLGYTKEAKCNNIILNIWSDKRNKIEKKYFKLNYDHFIKTFSSAPINYVENL